MLDMLFNVVVFFKQKTAYEMRISDWSSDVCSSDLDERGHVVEPLARAAVLPELHDQPMLLLGHARRAVERQLLLVPGEIGDRHDQVDGLLDRKSTRLNSSH